eukprot:Protomagalhaensia_sp_Gyna_25__3387@NODE_305_length_3980_cov_17_871352_g236_i0_p1_GENE_NODE_305_length_3980_cov_17_871352_g236_i0NODE_305_length_3980_cov_17_871352_g236_i0_p1_ORF_typecomplete_len649_score153_20HOOK/PF05622_12/0_00013UPF0242/PF06785_11/7_9e03UPF0242/PF06785_11/1_4e04UPF0242/PF06785_11/0_0014Cep57_CLD_2/PF14197_6/1_6e03Cep57_CLD_2/PF14197_6/1_5e03Cep57_CLD_2/PF14197_6/0_036Cep57_CLD_2/PF14197_6/9_4AAA_13/PF13166_6/0_22AAA_13/PF13166_6/9_3e03Phage_HK97_TLTM/PF06120_11/1_7e02Phage_HK
MDQEVVTDEVAVLPNPSSEEWPVQGEHGSTDSQSRESISLQQSSLEHSNAPLQVNPPAEQPAVLVPTQGTGELPKQPVYAAGLGLRFNVLKKASHTASNFLSSAGSSTIKNAMSLGASLTESLTDIVQASMEEIDPESGMPESKAPVEILNLPPEQVPDSVPVVSTEVSTRNNSVQSQEHLSDSESQQLQLIERLSLQMGALEDGLEQYRQREAGHLAEIGKLRDKVAEERRRVAELDRQKEAAVRDATTTLKDRLQKELEDAMTDNERRMCDIRVLLKQKDQQLKEYEAERERRSLLLEETTEAQSHMEEDLAAERSVVEALREELTTVAAKHQRDLEEVRRQAVKAEDERRSLECRLEEVEEGRQRAEHLARSAESATRQLHAQVSSLKSKLSPINLLERSTQEAAISLLSGEERNLLEQNSQSPDDILSLFKKSQTLITTLERKLALSDQGLQTARTEVSGLQQQLERAEMEIESLKNRLMKHPIQIDSAERGPSGGFVQEGSAPDASVVAVLEARLNAKTERVEALVCEVAQLKSQLASHQSNEKANPSPLLDSGRDSWLWQVVVVPILMAADRWGSQNVKYRIESKARWYHSRINRYTLYADSTLRRLVNVMAPYRIPTALYLMGLHVLMLYLLLAANGSTVS